jgi:hypothetical protein
MTASVAGGGDFDGELEAAMMVAQGGEDVDGDKSV